MSERNGARARAFDAYARGFDTLPPSARVAFAYEAAIRFLKEAEAAIGRGEIEARWRASERARTIVRTLEAALDRERGGEIAARLGALYRYVDQRLTALNVRNDAAIARELIALLDPLREAWARLGRGNDGANATAPDRGSEAPTRRFALSA